MRCLARGVLTPFLLLLIGVTGCVGDVGDELDDTDSLEQFGGGPGGGGTTPPPDPCTVQSPYQPIRYQILQSSSSVTFSLPAGCTKYFQVRTKGPTHTDVFVDGSIVSPLTSAENPDLFVTRQLAPTLPEVPGPANPNGCHATHPAGQGEYCFSPALSTLPESIYLKWDVNIAVRAVTALDLVTVTVDQYSAWE